MGSDDQGQGTPSVGDGFQSTLPGWGATNFSASRSPRNLISIHAPRMGSDPPPMRRMPPRRHFNPRSPDGERLKFNDKYFDELIFQSTLPGWGATAVCVRQRRSCFISIHAPRMGSDREITAVRSRVFQFQSTLPGWGATKDFLHDNL